MLATGTESDNMIRIWDFKEAISMHEQSKPFLKHSLKGNQGVTSVSFHDFSTNPEPNS